MTLDTIWQDVRYAVRSLRRTPALAGTAVVTLALGIGANTAIFSLVQAVLLRQLPVASPGDLYFVAHGVDGRLRTAANVPWLERVRQRTDVFAGVTAYNHRQFKVTSDLGTEPVLGQYVSGNYHAVVGVPMAMGRGFMTENDRLPGGSPIAVISDAYWSRSFGRAPDVIGRTLTVGGNPVTITGVTAPGFAGLSPGDALDITLPLSMRIQDEPGLLTATDSWISLPIVVRIKSGVSSAVADQALESAFRAYMAEPFNAEFARLRDGRTTHASLLSAAYGTADLRDGYATALQVLMGMVGLVLLIACANVANLMLIRAAGRRREIGVRMAIGASRLRILRQFLVESLVLALAGGALGFVLAGWGSIFVTALLANGANPIVIDAQPDRGVLLFTVLVSLATGIGFGLAPAYAVTRAPLAPGLKGLPPAATRSWPGRYGVVAAQIALCLVLVFAAGLLSRTLQNLRGVEAGFRKDGLLVFGIDARDTLFPVERLTAACDDIIGRLRSRPGVVAASCSTMSPVETNSEGRALTVPDFTPPPDDPDFVYANSVDAGYFDTLGIGLISGRAFTPKDTASSSQVAVVSESAARYYFGGAGTAVGRVFRWGRRDPRPPVTIVGVVRDAKLALREDPPQMIYTPLDQRSEAPRELLASVRTATSPSSFAPAVREDVAAVSQHLALRYVRSMDEQINAALVGERLLAMLSIAFAGLALLLASLGLYGVLSYDVSRRTHDIGIRLALGARRLTIVSGVLRQVAAVTALGIVAGGVAASLLSDAVSGFLFGIESGDAQTLVAAATVLAGTALLAGYFPARRAARVEPNVALRAE